MEDIRLHETIDNLLKNKDAEEEIDILLQEKWKRNLAIAGGAIAGTVAAAFGAYKGFQYVKRKRGGRLSQCQEWWAEAVSAFLQTVGRAGVAGARRAVRAAVPGILGDMAADGLGQAYEHLRDAGKDATEDILAREVQDFVGIPIATTRVRRRVLRRYSETADGDRRLRSLYAEARSLRMSVETAILVIRQSGSSWLNDVSCDALLDQWADMEPPLLMDWTPR